MGLSCPSGISRAGPARKSPLLVMYKSFIDQAYLVKTGSRLGIWLVLFYLFLLLLPSSRSINEMHKTTCQ